MSDIKLKDNGDIEIGSNGDLVLTSGVDAIRQHLAQRIRTQFNEWFLDRSVGIPYIQHVFVKNPNPTVIDASFKTTILDTPGVLELLSFDIDVDLSTRAMTVVFSARTSEGVIDFTEVLG